MDKRKSLVSDRTGAFQVLFRQEALEDAEAKHKQTNHHAHELNRVLTIKGSLFVSYANNEPDLVYRCVLNTTDKVNPLNQTLNTIFTRNRVKPSLRARPEIT